VRVLLDENLPHDLIAGLVGHSVSTVQGLGWAGTKNGDLLRRASDVTDAFVTMDGKLEYQHDISVLRFGVVVVGAPSNRMSDLTPLVPEMLAALDTIRPGKVEHVGRAGRRRDHLKKT
jgi:Domain of unknown function (DUF5615)